MFLLFEVMDKELSLPFIWVYFGIIGVAGFLLARKHPAFLVLIIPLWLLVAPLHISEINDPFVGKDILREAGYSYVVQSYLAVSLAALLPGLGVLSWIRRVLQEADKPPANQSNRAAK
jgi:hypothetical protein